MGTYRYIVLTNPVEGREDEYNDWYSNIHLPDLVAIPGFTAAQRFKATDLGDGTSPKFKYLAIYEVETDDIKATMDGMMARAGTDKMVLSDALDVEGVYNVLYEPFGARAVEGKKT